MGLLACAAGEEAAAVARALSKEFPLLQSCIDVVVEGGLEYGLESAREIIETTKIWGIYCSTIENWRVVLGRPTTNMPPLTSCLLLLRRTSPIGGSRNNTSRAPVAIARRGQFMSYCIYWTLPSVLVHTDNSLRHRPPRLLVGLQPPD
jgi:hypothetical protein